MNANRRMVENLGDVPLGICDNHVSVFVIRRIERRYSRDARKSGEGWFSDVHSNAGLVEDLMKLTICCCYDDNSHLIVRGVECSYRNDILKVSQWSDVNPDRWVIPNLNNIASQRRDNDMPIMIVIGIERCKGGQPRESCNRRHRVMCTPILGL